MIVTLAFVWNFKGVLLLLAAIVFAVLAGVLLLPAPRANWPLGVAAGGWSIAMVAWFIWAAGG